MQVRELTPDEFSLAYDAMSCLRPHLASREEFVKRATRQAESGYRIVAAFADDGDPLAPAVGAAGFRFIENLAWGRFCYIDDLIVVPTARRQGHAVALLAWIDEAARAAGMDEVHLDSGVQAERLDAHRRYFNAGYRITSYHFAKVPG